MSWYVEGCSADLDAAWLVFQQLQLALEKVYVGSGSNPYHYNVTVQGPS